MWRRREWCDQISAHRVLARVLLRGRTSIEIELLDALIDPIRDNQSLNVIEMDRLLYESGEFVHSSRL